MKLSKENIYVDLRGKSKEELTELYNFLISVGEKPFRDKEWFLNYSNDNEKVGFSDVHFCGLGDILYKEKTEVTIEQLKEILKPMEEALTLDNIQVNCNGLTKKEITNISDIIYNKKGTRPILTINGYIIHKYQPKKTTITYEKFMELFGNKETLQEKEQRLLEELKEVRKEIEDSKIKEGDWVVINETDTIFKVKENDFRFIDDRHKKITDSVLIESLNKLF